MEEIDTETRQLMDKLVANGFVYENEDGTFGLSEEAEQHLQNELRIDPTLFAKWFPDRLN